MTLDVHLNYGGNCEQAFRIYEQHLGGKVTMLMRHGESSNPGTLRSLRPASPSCGTGSAGRGCSCTNARGHSQ